MADTPISFPAQAPTGPTKHNADQNNPLVTLLPFALTAVTFLATFLFQIHQNNQQESFQQLQQQTQQDATLDSEWRKALEHLTAQDGPSASVGAYEMVSFLQAGKYSDQALAIIPSLLTKIDNPLTFDVVLFDINSHINQDSQSQLVAIDTILVKDLGDLCKRVPHCNPSIKDGSFAAFLQTPDEFIKNPKQTGLLDQAWTQIWELDSVSSALSNNWRGVHRVKPYPTPQGQDLSAGVVLLNNDWRGIDFSQAADLDGVAIFGKCKIDQTTKLSSSMTVRCTSR
jgi:hypothetical protein